MKKTLLAALLFLMAVAVLASCGKTGNSSGSAGQQNANVSVDSLKTLGDVIKLDAEDKQTSATESNYVYAFKLGETYYRAIASISKDTFDAIIDLDFNDKKYDEKLNKIISPLKIEKMENLSERAPSQAELDGLIGKTVQELLDNDWYNSGYNLETMEFSMNHGIFCYTLILDGKVEEEDYEDFDFDKDAKDMKVKEVVDWSIGEATNLETE